MSMTWDPGQYLAFASHRLRPAIELLMRIPLDAPDTVVDLGCGTGNVTGTLRGRWPDARLTGIDGSPEMLAEAAKTPTRADWRMADIGTWTPAEPVDVLYSNAALQWIEGHAALFPRLMRCIRPGGALAVQMPRNFAAPSHTLMFETADDGPWAARLRGVQRRSPVSDARFYYDLLAPHAKEIDLWETEYHQVLSGDNPVAEFTKGSWLKTLLDALEEPLRSAYWEEYRRRVAAAYPRRADGRTIFPFKRLFVVARA
jgi:trans-aconitate 2-methyltransferase